MDESTELEHDLDFECPRDEINDYKNESTQGDNIEDFGTENKKFKNCVLNNYTDEKDAIKCDNNYHLFSVSQTIFTNLKSNKMETLAEGDQDPIINFNFKNNLKKSNDKDEKLPIKGHNVRHVKKIKSIVKAKEKKQSVNQKKVRSNNIESPQMTELELPKSDLNITDEDKGKRAKEKQEISENGDLLKEISELKRLKSEQDARISEQSSLTSGQKSKISQQAARISEQESEILRKIDRISEQDAKISQELSRISEQDAKIAQHIARISEQEVKISQQEQQIFELAARISEQDIKISQQVVKISEQDAKIYRYLVAGSQQDAKISQHISRIAEQEAKIFQQANKISEQKVKITNQETKISDQEVKISDQEARISDQEAKISQQVTKLSEQDVKIVNQDTKISDQIAKISEQANRISEQDAKIADHNTKISEQNAKVADQFTEISQQVFKISDQSIEIIELDIKIADQNTIISDQKAKISELVTRISEQEIKIADQDTKIFQQVIRISEQDVKIAEQGKNITELAKQNNHLKRNICSLFKVAKKNIGEKDKLLSEANMKQEHVLTAQSIKSSVQIPDNTDKDLSLKEISVESKNEELLEEKSPVEKSTQHLEQRNVLDSNCNSVEVVFEDSKSNNNRNSKRVEKKSSKCRKSSHKSKSIKPKLNEDSEVGNESGSHTWQYTNKKVLPKGEEYSPEESLSVKDGRVSKLRQIAENVALSLKSSKKETKKYNLSHQSDSSDVQSPEICSKKRLAKLKLNETSCAVKDIDGKKSSSDNVSNDTWETCGEGGYSPIQTKSCYSAIEAMEPVESKSELSFSQNIKSFSHLNSAEQSSKQPPVQLMEISESNSITNVTDNKSDKILKLVSNQANNTVFEVQNKLIKLEAILPNEASSEQKTKSQLSEVYTQVNELNNWSTNAVRKHSSSEFIPIQTLHENFYSVVTPSQNCDMKVSQEMALNSSAQIVKTDVLQGNLVRDHCFAELKEAPEHGQFEPNLTQYVLRSIEIDSNSPQKILFDLDDEKMKDPRLRSRHAKIKKRLVDVTFGEQKNKEPEDCAVKISESSLRAADVRYRTEFTGIVPSHSRDPRLKAKPFFANESTEQKIADFLKSIRNAEESNSNDTAPQMEFIDQLSDSPFSFEDKELCDSVDSSDSLRRNPYIRDIEGDLKVTVVGDRKSENPADLRRVYKQVDVSSRHSVFSKRLAQKLNIDIESTSSSRFNSGLRSSPSVRLKRIEDLSDEENFSSKRMKMEFEESDHEPQVSLTKEEKERIYNKLKRSSERCTGRKVMIGKPVKKIPESLKSDAIRLFHYKNTKVPFLVKRELKK